MAYNEFAYFYDEFNGEADYDALYAHIHKELTAHGITDGAVTMAAKGHLRNGKPVVLAIATNDGLSASAPNIAVLLNRKNYYFVPFGQDNAEAKPTSLIADFRKIIPTAEAALEGRQIQPILL